MSSFKAELIVDGRIYALKHCSFNYVQSVRSDGMPATKVRGGSVDLILQNPAPKEIIQWVLNPTDRRSGAVRFYEVNAMTGTHQLLEFTDAFCTRFNNSYNGESHGTGTLISTFTIVAQQLSLDGESFNQ